MGFKWRCKTWSYAIYLKNNETDYSVDENYSRDFYLSVSRFMPFLQEDGLHPDQAGIRPKLQQPGDTVRDFIISEESDKGFCGFINLAGMESHGLTYWLHCNCQLYFNFT